MILVRTAIGAAMVIGLSALLAQARCGVELTQHGSDVVATGSGSIDLTGLTFDIELEGGADLFPAIGSIVTGPTSVAVDLYFSTFTGPARFGSGGETVGSSGAGDGVGLAGVFGYVYVPHDYVSGAPLSDTSTFSGASLGVTPGRYEWTWGSGANQNFTLVIGTDAAPEPSTWAMMLLGFAGLAFAGYRRAKAGHALARFGRALTTSP
jgi:hypothetical protein